MKMFIFRHFKSSVTGHKMSLVFFEKSIMCMIGFQISCGVTKSETSAKHSETVIPQRSSKYFLNVTSLGFLRGHSAHIFSVWISLHKLRQWSSSVVNRAESGVAAVVLTRVPNVVLRRGFS